MGSHDIDSETFQFVARPSYLVPGLGPEPGPRPWGAAGLFVGTDVRMGEEAILGTRWVIFRDLEPRRAFLGSSAREARSSQCVAAEDPVG
jgi:acetyltransferase-like isoleucine patch superfamily enzyme